MTQSWTTILRRKYVEVRMARDWQTHAGQTWAWLEVENRGAREFAIDFVPNHDELRLQVLPPRASEPVLLCWISPGRPSKRDRAIARLRYDAGTLYARLGPGERWRFPTSAVDAAKVEQSCRAGGAALVEGCLRLVTADAVRILEFERSGVPLPTKVVQADALPALQPMLDRQPEAMSAALRGVTEPDTDSPAIEVVRLHYPTFHLRGFARDDARIPASHEPFLDEVARSLERIPGFFRVHATGYTEKDTSWPGSGVDELALARARAVANRIGSELMGRALGNHAGSRSVELWLPGGPKGHGAVDASRANEPLPSHLLALVRSVPALRDLPHEAGPALRELSRLRHLGMVALLAPDCVLSSE